MPARISELAGFLFGYLTGVFFAVGSILRNARIFHPRGLLFSGNVETLPESPIAFPPHALVRFSGGWWKFQEWPDVLGIAVRMGPQPFRSVHPGGSDRDLLFASFARPWQVLSAPFLTEHHDYLANHYYTVSPFSLDHGERVEFMIAPSKGHRSAGTRDEKLLGNVIGGRVVLRLLMKELKGQNWRLVAKIAIKEELALDQESLRFHPFRCGDGLRPVGFVQHMRIGSYRLSQWVRPGAEEPEAEFSRE